LIPSHANACSRGHSLCALFKSSFPSTSGVVYFPLLFATLTHSPLASSFHHGRPHRSSSADPLVYFFFISPPVVTTLLLLPPSGRLSASERDSPPAPTPTGTTPSAARARVSTSNSGLLLIASSRNHLNSRSTSRLQLLGRRRCQRGGP
jgi:hypothetical protein